MKRVSPLRPVAPKTPAKSSKASAPVPLKHCVFNMLAAWAATDMIGGVRGAAVNVRPAANTLALVTPRTVSQGICNGTSQAVIPAAFAARVAQDLTSSYSPLGKPYEEAWQVQPSAAQLAYLADPSQSPVVPDNLTYTPFTVNLYPSGAPVMADINQHAIGDCDGVAALASLARQWPNVITNMITDNRDGTFNVSMYMPNGESLMVGVNSDFLGAPGNVEAVSSKPGAAGAATWATVLEKAAMKYIDVFPLAANADLGGIYSYMMLPMFTGNGASYTFAAGALTAAQLSALVQDATNLGSMITCQFSSVETDGSEESTINHGYTVFPTQNSSAMFSARNPWGVLPTTAHDFDPSTDGVLDVPATNEWANTVYLRIMGTPQCPVAPLYAPVPAQGSQTSSVVTTVTPTASPTPTFTTTPTTSPTVTQTASPTFTTTPTASPTVTQTASPTVIPNVQKLSTGASIGLGVGVGLPALAAVIWGLTRCGSGRARPRGTMALMDTTVCNRRPVPAMRAPYAHQPAGARTYFEQDVLSAINAAPTNMELRRALVQHYIERNDLQAALTAINDALAWAPSDNDLLDKRTLVRETLIYRGHWPLV